MYPIGVPMTLQVVSKLSKFKAQCMCQQCSALYECNPYDARKSKVGDLCKACKTQITSLANPQQADLLKVFDYDPWSGIVTYKQTSLSGMAGHMVGYSHSQGYLSVAIGESEYLLHRVIWCMQTGQWPYQVDHKNHNRRDNRWENLREINASRENQLNMSKRVSKLGVQGVRQLPGGKYWAYIMINRKQVGLGSYDTVEEAAKARKDAELKNGFHANHGM